MGSSTPTGSETASDSDFGDCFPCPFVLPLRGSESDEDWRSLVRANLQNLVQAVHGVDDDWPCTAEPRPDRVAYWRSVIQDLQKLHENWMSRWLRSYGTTGLDLLTDAQFEALVGVSKDRFEFAVQDGFQRMRRPQEVHRALSALVAANVSAPWLFLEHSHRYREERTPRPYLHRPSPLRQVATIGGGGGDDGGGNSNSNNNNAPAPSAS